MSENCTHDCSTCTANCASRGEEGRRESFLESPHKLSSINKVIGIVSGKGGVGKSLVTSLLACGIQRRGLHAAILDADITGPSIPRMFGISEKAKGDEEGIYPVTTTMGIDVISINLLLENDTDPVVWRGPVVAGAVKQFWTDVVWHKVDVMFIDMPPGTGDVPLTVFQSIPVDGIVVVTSPQQLVSMIVSKAVKMADMMKIPILGIVENMSYFKCPDCGNTHDVLGESHIEELAKEYGIERVSRLPIDPLIAKACDRGLVEVIETDNLNNLLDHIQSML